MHDHIIGAPALSLNPSDNVFALPVDLPDPPIPDRETDPEGYHAWLRETYPRLAPLGDEYLDRFWRLIASKYREEREVDSGPAQILEFPVAKDPYWDDPERRKALRAKYCGIQDEIVDRIERWLFGPPPWETDELEEVAS